MRKISTHPYKGTRDFYPEDQFIQNYIFSIWKKVVQSFGYLEYNAPLIEETDLYRAKTGEEIVKEQTYTFIDRGQRDVTLRPEMTPSVARMVAAKRKELGFPLRWFSIPNLFRYERPQHGRLREHWQLNADIFGVDSLDADAEIISLAYQIMKAFSAEDKDFLININNRRNLNNLVFKMGLSEEKQKAFRMLLDKKEKIKDFDQQAESLLGKPFDFVAGQDQETVKLIQVLKDQGITNVHADPFLVRGFDYYTGIVFEIFDANPDNKRSIFGGGRYDDLVGIFGVEPVPGVGFGLGDVTMRDFLQTHGLLPPYRSMIDLYICKLDSTFTNYANQLAQYLRKQGLNVAVDLTDRKVPAQIKTADRQKIPFVLVIGEEEVTSSKFKVKNLVSGKESLYNKEEIANRLRVDIKS